MPNFQEGDRVRVRVLVNQPWEDGIVVESANESPCVATRVATMRYFAKYGQITLHERAWYAEPGVMMIALDDSLHSMLFDLLSGESTTDLVWFALRAFAD